MTIKTVTRRAIGPLAILAGFAGCNHAVWGNAHSYLAEAFGHPRVIYDSGIGFYFFMYELSEKTTARVVDEGLAFEGFHAPARRESKFSSRIRWFETPMFSASTQDKPWRLRPEVEKTLGPHGLNGYDTGTNFNRLSPDDERVYKTVRDALNHPGNYFGMGDAGEAFGIVDVRHRLMMLTRSD